MDLQWQHLSMEAGGTKCPDVHTWTLEEANRNDSSSKQVSQDLSTGPRGPVTTYPMISGRYFKERWNTSLKDYMNHHLHNFMTFPTYKSLLIYPQANVSWPPLQMTACIPPCKFVLCLSYPQAFLNPLPPFSFLNSLASSSWWYFLAENFVG